MDTELVVRYKMIEAVTTYTMIESGFITMAYLFAYSVFQVACHEGRLNKQKPHLNANYYKVLCTNSPIVDGPAKKKKICQS